MNEIGYECYKVMLWMHVESDINGTSLLHNLQWNCKDNFFDFFFSWMNWFTLFYGISHTTIIISFDLVFSLGAMMLPLSSALLQSSLLSSLLGQLLWETISSPLSDRFHNPHRGFEPGSFVTISWEIACRLRPLSTHDRL